MESPLPNSRKLVTVDPALKVNVTPIPLVSPIDNSQPNPAVTAARSALATKLKIQQDAVKLVGLDAVQWPDGCLGVKQPGVTCLQVIVDGFVVILEANGTRYTYHTDETGRQAVLASPR